MINGKRQKITRIILYIVLSIGLIACVYPLFFMFVASTRVSGDIFLFPPPITFGDKFFENLKNLQDRIPIWSALFNSFKIAIIYTAINLLICSMAAYSISKFNYKGRNIVFIIIMLTMMLPAHAKLVPLYRMMTALKLSNTHLAIILPDIAGAFGIFLMRQNFHAVPDTLIEAARIDGANEWTIFVKIVMPLMIPALTALGIYMFVAQWTNFTWPLIILNDPEKFTLPVALAQLKADTRIDYGQIMVGAIFAVAPIMAVFLALQKYFISGLTGGAVKE